VIRSNAPAAGSRVTRLRIAFVALLAAAFVFPLFVPAQEDEDAEERAQREAAEAAARAAAEERQRQQVFNQYLQQVRELRAREAELIQQKEAEARRDLAEQQRRTQEAIARRDRAEAYSQQLDQQWEANEARIEEISALLRQHEGNLGELFGVTRQIAGDAAGVLRESLISTQFVPAEGEEERAEFMVRIAAAKALPSIRELERVWFELMREMKASGEVVRYTAAVLQLREDVEEEEGGEGLAEQVAEMAGGEGQATTPEDRLGEPVPMEVVRVGSFTALSGDEFLGYLPSRKQLTQLDGELPSYFRDIGQSLFNTPPDAGYTRAIVDPASGSLLGLYLQRPSWLERIALGEAVGYVIIAVGIIGLVVALFQYAYLFRTRLAVRVQLNNLDKPRDDNPLGRLLLAFGGKNGQTREPESAELAELRLSEAVLREVPKLERFQSFLRLAVAAGPLLGLIGTVIGMIITFHAIVASGSSDPKLMAHGIGQAMIATVLGLGIAIPLLFINAGLTAFSRGITQILDEQSEALLAETIIHSRKRQRAAS
jgi:biopolymer transport protein ExbB